VQRIINTIMYTNIKFYQTFLGNKKIFLYIRNRSHYCYTFPSFTLFITMRITTFFNNQCKQGNNESCGWKNKPSWFITNSSLWWWHICIHLPFAFHHNKWHIWNKFALMQWVCILVCLGKELPTNILRT